MPTEHPRVSYTPGVGSRVRDDAVFLLVRAFLALGGHLSYRTLQRLGGRLGRLALRLAGRDRARAMDHLAIAFPELSEDERSALVRRSALHLGQTLGEVAWLWHATAEPVAEVCPIDGVEHLRGALEQGRGAVLVTAHCGNWELLNASLGAHGIPMTIAVRELYDPRLDRIVTTLRERFGAEVVARGDEAGRRLAAALKANRVDGLLIDQDIRDVPSTFVPFFGRPAWTPIGAAALALRARCAVIPAFVHRRQDGSHSATVSPPLALPQEGSLRQRTTELTAAATAAIERQIRSHPEQWVWMHRRWRTQPEPEPALALTT